MAKRRVESEVTGNVWKVVVAVGDHVGEGDVLIILESMKMEIPLESPIARSSFRVVGSPAGRRRRGASARRHRVAARFVTP